MGERVHATQGIPKIIPEIRIVAARYKIRVLFLGGGDTKSIAAANHDLPIEWLGLQNDLNKYYAQADCALFATRSEACSFAGIEAMARGLPVITSNVPGMREMFDGVALMVSMTSDGTIEPKEYAAAMLKVIEDTDLRHEMSLKSRIRYLKKYTASSMAQKTAALYRKLVAN